MRQHSSGERRTKTLLGLLSLCLLLLVLQQGAFVVGGTSRNVSSPRAVVEGASALSRAEQTLPRRPWTAIGSTGAPDEASLSTYGVNGANFGFRVPSSGSVVVARYNVTNTFDNNANPNMPNWNTLEMGSNAPLNCIISATLYRVKYCSQDAMPICTAQNRSNDHPCATCQFPNNTFDFGTYLYFVEVKLDRSNALASMPVVYTLRVY
jgi:hypothetical protein